MSTASPLPINVKRRHAFAVPYALVAGLLSLLFALAFVEGVSIITLLTGPSLAVVLSWVGFAVGFAVSLVAYRRLVHLDTRLSEVERLSESQSGRNWLSRLAIALAVGLFIPGATLAIFWLLDPMLENQPIIDPVVVVITVVYGGGIAYMLAGGLCMLGTGGLISMTGAVLLTGLALAIINVQDSTWFDNTLSYLSQADGSALIFQMTFVIAGAVFLAVMRDLTGNFRVLRDLGGLSDHRFNSIRLILLALPLLFTGIGLFPLRLAPIIDFLHNFCGHMSVVVNVALMLTIDRFAPIYARAFVWQSRVAAGSTLLIWLGYQTFALYNFVVLEVLLMVVVAVWTWQFYRQTERYMRAYVIQISTQQAESAGGVNDAEIGAID